VSGTLAAQIFIPVGYLTMTLLTGRVAFGLVTRQFDDDDIALDGFMALFVGLFWPVALAVAALAAAGYPAWVFVTMPARKRQRAADAKRRAFERDHQITYLERDLGIAKWVQR